MLCVKERGVAQNMGSLVISSAPSMSMIIGTAAGRVTNPIRISTPQPVSETPSNVLKNVGAGIPALWNRPDALPHQPRTPNLGDGSHDEQEN